MPKCQGRCAGACITCLCLLQIVKECNEGVRKMSRTEELISIEKMLEFKCKVALLIKLAELPGRRAGMVHV